MHKKAPSNTFTKPELWGAIGCYGNTMGCYGCVGVVLGLCWGCVGVCDFGDRKNSCGNFVQFLSSDSGPPTQKHRFSKGPFYTRLPGHMHTQPPRNTMKLFQQRAASGAARVRAQVEDRTR